DDGRDLRPADVLLEARREDGADAERDREAGEAADRRDDEGLDEELPEDRPRLGAERHLDADLLRPLVDDDVHDVRDADPADDERQRADDAEEEREREHEDLEELEL